MKKFYKTIFEGVNYTYYLVEEGGYNNLDDAVEEIIESQDSHFLICPLTFGQMQKMVERLFSADLDESLMENSQCFTENLTIDDPNKERSEKMGRTAPLLRVEDSQQIEHLDVALTRYVIPSVFKDPTSKNNWSGREQSLAIPLPEKPNQVRCFNANVLFPAEERYAELCGDVFGLLHEFAYTLLDYTYLSLMEVSSKPYEYIALDLKLCLKCVNVATQFGIPPDRVDLPQEKMGKRIQNTIKAYFF